MDAQQNKLFVGNLPYSIRDEQLKELFEQVEGVEVTDAKVIIDKTNDRSKGFGFVTLADDAMAQTAIEKMNGFDIEGRQLSVNIARPLKDHA